jgi:hypothetical protein
VPTRSICDGISSTLRAVWKQPCVRSIGHSMSVMTRLQECDYWLLSSSCSLHYGSYCYVMLLPDGGVAFCHLVQAS